MKPRYRVLISTRGIIAIRFDIHRNDSYQKWQDDYRYNIYSKEYLDNYRTIQDNQVNYFIPLK